MCKNTYLGIVTARVVLGVLENVSVTFIDETDLQNLEEKEKTIGSTLSKPWYPGT